MEKITNVRRINMMRCAAGLACSIVMVILVNVAFWLNLSNALARDWPNIGLRTLRMFTTLSNLLVSVAAMLSIPYQIEGFRKNNYHLPRWIVTLLYTGVTGVAITFVTAITAITIAQGFYAAMIKDTNLFLHLINPVISILMFTLINDDHNVKFKTTFVALIPMFIYTVIYIVLVFVLGEDNGGWNDHYQFNKFVAWPIAMIIMYAIGFGSATLLRVLHNKTHARRKRAFVVYFQQSPEVKADTIEEAVAKLAVLNRKDNEQGGEIKIPLRSIRMMLPAYETDKSLKDLLKIYIDNNVSDDKR